MAGFTFDYGRNKVRFAYLFNYPKGVSYEDGEKWFFNEHVPEVKKISGIVSYKTWKALPPISMWTYDPYDRFVRMVELVFPNMEACVNATLRNPELWASGVEGRPGFYELECMMLDEEPQYNLIKDVPAQQYKYIQNPAIYTPGKMIYDDSDDVIIDVYMFNYKPELSFVEGEEWYLGHHVREGKLTKQHGQRHYKTWKTLDAPFVEGSNLNPNRFYRMTELGLPQSAVTMEKVPLGIARIRYTFLDCGQVIGEWRNILINPDERQDLLA